MLDRCNLCGKIHSTEISWDLKEIDDHIAMAHKKCLETVDESEKLGKPNFQFWSGVLAGMKFFRDKAYDSTLIELEQMVKRERR